MPRPGRKRLLTSTSALLFGAYVIAASILNSCSSTNKPNPIDSDLRWLTEVSAFDQAFIAGDTLTLKQDTSHMIGTINGISFLRDGSIVAFDNLAHQLLLYDKSGKLRRQIGKKGKGPGEYTSLQDISIDSDNNIFLFDNINRKVTVYSDAGAFLRSCQVGFGYYLLSARDGSFYVYNSISLPGTKGITYYDSSGTGQLTFFGIPKNAIVDHIPIGPASFTRSQAGDILVVHGATYQVTLYNDEGVFLKRFGRKPAFFTPLTPPIYPPDMSKVNRFTPASKS